VIARSRCRYPVHLYPHASPGLGGPVRGHVAPRRAATLATAGVVGFLPRRALLSLHRALATALSGAHLPSPVAPLPRRATLLRLDHAGIAGLANTIGGPAAPRAERAPSSRHLPSRAALTYHLSPLGMPASWSAALLAPLEELQRHATRHRCRDVLAKLQDASVEQAIAHEFD
jgi:hypothetical protein